ncbi:hypothetical protein SM007_28570 [Streptomyces avermitilis]|uniref:Uncharacterized protein n=1 Tax=Streptomyces avermitilis TaxID=33903 RepID=A0A4D4ME83_STRAX|nr:MULTISPECIES: hypothetical protein [Streptomyces]MYS95837.1 hypothetical protein [Streptomyces sp. SID5469]OOV24797.1 hypothetical protein SM007_28570 [Streptomyces avermitilis]BBJ47513.1 hypothetical protein SAVMC3_01420 [Streptomyces avermitilis]GDY68962.1 hypothetical protein SAV14893_083550 [Streptomyces avermitilis]GDY70105.1 hypothetical protein SAV14893_094980 [Streptomyces avermitilis]
MSEALYGLFGVLGGTLITGAVAYWGPIQVQKRALLQAREERELVRVEAELRQRERLEMQADREFARADSEATEQVEKRKAAVARVVLVRQAVAAWYDLLDQTIIDLEQSRESSLALDLSEFLAAHYRCRDALQSAGYGALEDGLRIMLTTVSAEVELSRGIIRFSPAVEERVAAQSARHPSVTGDAFLIVDALNRTSFQLRRAIRIGPTAQGFDATLTEAQESLLAARRCRAELSRLLMREVDSLLDVTVIDTRNGGAAPE